MRRRFVAVFAALCTLALTALPAPARAELAINIDKSTQRMTVALNGAELFVWPVSTGVAGYDTPSGTFTPFRLEKDHFSREWDDAPMPHSVFFTMQGHAIHGSNHIKAIGTPASHGCVRLEPKNAKILFDLVKQEGMKNVRVTLSGEAPGADGVPQVASRNGFERSFSTNSLDDAGPSFGTIPSPRRSRTVREYRNGRTYVYRERTYYHPPRYGYAPPPPYYFGPYR